MERNEAAHIIEAILFVAGEPVGIGDVAAALEGLDDGDVGLILDEVRAGIGEEKDPDRACILNIRHSMDVIGKDLPLEDGAVIVGALYDIGSGRVDFLRDRTS